MARRPNLIPSQLLNVALPLPVFTQLSVHLYSELEQRIPHGAYSRLLTELIREYFAAKHVDLAPYLGSPPGAFIVRGSPEAMAALQSHLSKE